MKSRCAYAVLLILGQTCFVLAEETDEGMSARWRQPLVRAHQPAESLVQPAEFQAHPVLVDEGESNIVGPTTSSEPIPDSETPSAFEEILQQPDSSRLPPRLVGSSPLFDGTRRDVPGFDFYHPQSDFDHAFQIPGTETYFKIGGYVKIDNIHDFDAIDSTDSFVTSTIRTSGPSRQNHRLHARQSRLNMDVRWPTEYGTARAFFEADFFGANNTLRFRHAYGEIGRLTVGQTWTTFTDVDSLPTTLDTESSVAAVFRRQGLVRWTENIFGDAVELSVAIEDPSIIINAPPGIPGQPGAQPIHPPACWKVHKQFRTHLPAYPGTLTIGCEAGAFPGLCSGYWAGQNW